MNALFDTHSFLWAAQDPLRLSKLAREVIENAENTIFLSAATAWELTIKFSLGKLKLSGNPKTLVANYLTSQRFEALPVQLHHALHVSTLPPHHKDPFDRLLVAQSQLENLPIVTSDPRISMYAVKTIW